MSNELSKLFSARWIDASSEFIWIEAFRRHDLPQTQTVMGVVAIGPPGEGALFVQVGRGHEFYRDVSVPKVGEHAQRGLVGVLKNKANSPLFAVFNNL